MTHGEAKSLLLDAEDDYNQTIRDAETDLGIAEDNLAYMQRKYERLFAEEEETYHTRLEHAELALANAQDLYNARIEGKL